MGIIKRIIFKIFRLLIEGKMTRGFCSNAVHIIWKIWKKAWEEVDRLLGIAAREVFKRCIPVCQNKVFFHTQESRYGCNPKYICEELRKRDTDIDIVWRAPSKGRGGIPDDIRAVKINSFAYFKEMYSSKVIVSNSFLFLGQPVYLKKDQVLIQTWHGSLGIKKHGANDIKDTKRRVYALKKTGEMTSCCISNSSLETGSLRGTYWPDTPMLEYGHPRNDLFFDNHAEERERLRKALFEEWELEPETKVVMYAPTFRDDKNFACYDVDFDRLVSALGSRFGGSWCVLLRYHPALAAVYKKKGGSMRKHRARVVNVTAHFDMQELIAVTDVALTDYSSWIYDFVLLRKPGFIFATDIDKYNTERGFYYPLEETPFSIALNNDDLEKNILSFDMDAYSRRVEEFLIDKGCIEDGHASERVADLIERITKGQRSVF